MKKWTIEQEDVIYKNNVFSLVKKKCRHPHLDQHDFFMLETRDWINVIAVTEENQFVMVKQHRLGTDEITIETPGGLTEKGENPEDTAKRELLEETGYECQDLHLLKKLSVNPAILNNYIYFYYSGSCRKVTDQNLDSAEDIEILLLSDKEIRSMIENGSINHSIIVTALNLFFNTDHYKEKQ